jgi:alpha-tubulin suppressor-like RCC1 family protein
MSAYLWRHFLQQDVDAFRQFVADATFTSASSSRPGASSNVSQKLGSPATTSSLPTPLPKTRKSLGGPQYGIRNQDGKAHGQPVALTRADINSRDGFGRTLLHHVASSRQSNAVEFVTALLSVPYLDLYAQDTESGWTALHRALYFGNVAIAQALMLRDIKDATDYTTSGLHGHAGGLIKIKDHEGNSPFEVFGLTIAPRTLAEDARTLAANGVDDESGNSVDLDQISTEENGQRRPNKARVNLLGDDVFAFGSNKNLSLGLGDEDDRQYPERVNLRRPEHLLRRFHQEHILEKPLPTQDLSASRTISSGNFALPALIRNQALKIQDVIMSKLHTAIITHDPEANLFVCGFGPGGRLGTGDEATRFSYVCIESGGLAGKRATAVALGQDHTIAVSASGEVFTWGSNKFGQLGYSLPQSSAAGEAPVQLIPRQLYGPMKREAIVGAAASSIHSAIFTSSALYTFGKNEGQLGLMDADARSLEMQVIPRRVGVSVLQSAIEMVSAIDRATSILLENHDLIVLTHYGFTKVVFQLEGFTNYFLQGSYATRYDPAGNYVRKVTSGGNTICAMSSFGEVFTIDVTKKVESTAGVSTTNPSKARNALPHPTRVWSIRKAHMAARDVAVGQSGSIILSTEAGSVWRKEKRAIIKDISSNMSDKVRSKDYKFVRIPNITRAVGVRSNAFGAFTAIRRDCDVTREQIIVDPPSIWNDILPLLAFKEYGRVEETSDAEDPQPRFWTPATGETSPARIRRAILLAKDAEADLSHLLSTFDPLADSQYDMWITSSVTDVRIPVHSFLIKSRSCVLRRALAEFQNTYYFSLGDVFSIEYGPDGQIQIRFKGADFLTITNLVLYMYTEDVVDVWHHTAKAPRSAARYRQVRTELMKIATNLEMKSLERAARVMTEPAKCLQLDMESAILDEDLFSDADLLIELADDAEMRAHSAILCCRCPFFDGLFHGRAGGAWISSRRTDAEEMAEMVKVDLKHIDAKTFRMVLRHIYADTGEELFDDVITNDLDEFLDLVIEVMSVANELMLDRLAQICQKLLGRFGMLQEHHRCHRH